MVDSNNCYLYWICKNTDNDIFTQGYVGISVNPESRWKSHLYKASTTNKNHKLYNALSKYKNDYALKILVCGSLDYCYDLEFKLRPTRNIGLNHAIGGHYTSKGRLTYSYTEDVKLKISEGVKRAYRENKDFADKQRACRKGKKASDLTRQRMSEASHKTDKTKWKNSQADRELWLKAEVYYQIYMRDVSISPKKFADKCGLPFGKIGSLLRNFRKGWNPAEDIEYLKFKEI